MFDITQDFIRSENGNVMEGLLYDVPQDSVRLLFILREPNCENEQSFWLKEVVHGRKEKGKNGNKILNTLTKLACFALGKQEPDILRECAFINLYPYDGKPRVDRKGGFSKTCCALKSLCKATDIMKSGYNRIKVIAKKRMELLKHLSDTNIRNIVTTADIFNYIANEDNNFSTMGIRKKNGKQFRIGSLIYDERIKVYEYYHPSAGCVNYQLLNDAIDRSISSCQPNDYSNIR